MNQKSNITKLPTIFADANFYTKFNKIMEMPSNSFSNYWQNHYVSFEVKDINGPEPKLIKRVFTSQETHTRIPLARDNQIIVRKNTYQCITAKYEYEIPMQPSQIPTIRNLVNHQLSYTRSRQRYFQEIQNISNTEKSAAASEVIETIPIKQIMKHEDKLDNKINPGQNIIKDLSADIINLKYPTAERKDVEQNLINYAQNKDKFIPQNTIEFYENARSPLKSAAAHPQLVPHLVADYKSTLASTEYMLQLLKKTYQK